MSQFRHATLPLFPEWATGPAKDGANSHLPCMPPEWTSNDAMQGYFGSLDANSKNAVVLRQREPRLAFWRTLLLNCFRTHPSLSDVDPIISPHILRTLLLRENVVPMGIQQIMDDLVERKIAVPLNEYVNPTANNWWTKLVGWVSPSKELATEYVLAPIVAERAAEIVKSIPHSVHLMSYNEFLSLSHGLSLDLLAQWMANITVFEVKGVKGVKFAQSMEQAKITDSDRALFHIGHSVHVLEGREKKYAYESASLRREVVVMLKSGNRSTAAMLLRRAKLYESQLEKSMKSRDQLLRIAASIEEAQTNAQVFEAMKLGAAALKSENEKVGGVDKVDELMDNVSELIEEQEMIATTIGGNAAQLTMDLDESILEKELAELIQEDRQFIVATQSKSPHQPQQQDQDALVKELQELSVPVKSPIPSSSQFLLEEEATSSSAPMEDSADPQGQAEPV